jgi:hypothetical protein
MPPVTWRREETQSPKRCIFQLFRNPDDGQSPEGPVISRLALPVPIQGLTMPGKEEKNASAYKVLNTVHWQAHGNEVSISIQIWTCYDVTAAINFSREVQLHAVVQGNMARNAHKIAVYIEVQSNTQKNYKSTKVYAAVSVYEITICRGRETNTNLMPLWG